MQLPKKTLRYYYWLISAFIKKNLKMLILSFFLTFVFVIAFISISPYIQTLFLTKTTIIGLVGKYNYANLPEEITNKISNGLTYVNEKGEIIPALASSWEVSSDNKIYTFHLKNNLLWNNGKKFVAKEMTYKFKDIQTKVLSDTAVRFTLKNTLGIFPAFLTRPVIEYPLNGVAGMYKADKIKTKNEVIKEIYLSPNQKGLSAIIYKFYNDEKQLISAYKLGEINEFRTNKKSQAEIFKQRKNTTVSESVDYSKLMTLFFNISSPQLKSKDVRQALVSAIDPKLFADLGEVAIGSIPPNSWAYNIKLKNTVYDKDEAEKVLKKNIEQDKKTQFAISTYYDYSDIAESIAKEYKNIGFPAEVNYQTYDLGQFDLFLAYWNVPTDPDQYYYWHTTQTPPKGGNIANYTNVKIDQLLEDGRNTMDKNQRKAIYYDFQRRIVDDPPAAFLYYPYVYTIKRK